MEHTTKPWHYALNGTVRPPRAQITVDPFSVVAVDDDTGYTDFTFSIANNEIACWAQSQFEWNIDRLKNVVRHILEAKFSMFGFVFGNGYEIEIDAVLTPNLDTHRVYGIDVAALRHQGSLDEAYAEVDRLGKIVQQEFGALVTRSLIDFSSALKDPIDAAFYCYRAIEGLCNHNAFRLGMDERSKKASKWEEFRKIVNVDRDLIDQIKADADPLRHNSVGTFTHTVNEHQLKIAKNIMSAYFKRL